MTQKAWGDYYNQIILTEPPRRSSLGDKYIPGARPPCPPGPGSERHRIGHQPQPLRRSQDISPLGEVADPRAVPGAGNAPLAIIFYTSRFRIVAKYVGLHGLRNGIKIITLGKIIDKARVAVHDQLMDNNLRRRRVADNTPESLDADKQRMRENARINDRAIREG